MPGRKFNAGSGYRYGFNGQENSDEIAAGLTTAMYWEYDSRTGRRWNVDPKWNFWESLYSCFGNNPIGNSDVNGDIYVSDNSKGNTSDGGGDKKKKKKKDGGKTKITTDAGHGVTTPKGADKGSPSCLPGDKDIPCKNGQNQVYESDKALEIEKLTVFWLSLFGFDVQRTRTEKMVTKDTRVEWRYQLANANNSNLLISFHLDSYGFNYKNNGMKILYQQDKTNEKASINLANTIATNLIGIIDISPKPAQSFKEQKRIGRNGKPEINSGLLNDFTGEAGVILEFGNINYQPFLEKMDQNKVLVSYRVAESIYMYKNENKKPVLPIFFFLFNFH